MTDILLQNIAKHVNLNDEEQQIVLNAFSKEAIKAKTILIKPGDEAHYTYFVLKGVLRSYTIDDNGTAHILNFATPGWWLADMYSYLTGKPAILYVDVIEDCEVLILQRTDTERLFNEIPKLERFFRILTENNLIANQQRILDKMALSAEERYEKFLDKFSNIVYCLSHKYIASYIGVTYELF